MAVVLRTWGHHFRNYSRSLLTSDYNNLQALRQRQSKYNKKQKITMKRKIVSWSCDNFWMCTLWSRVWFRWCILQFLIEITKLLSILQVTLFNFSKFSTTHLQISYLHLNFPLLSSSTHASSIFEKERQFQIFHEVESSKLWKVKKSHL